MSGQPSPEWLPVGHLQDTDESGQPRSASRSLSPDRAEQPESGEVSEIPLSSSAQKRPRDEDSGSVEEGEASESDAEDESPSRPQKRQRTEDAASEVESASAEEGEVSATSSESGDEGGEGTDDDDGDDVSEGEVDEKDLSQKQQQQQQEQALPEKASMGWNSAVNKGSALRTSFGGASSTNKAAAPSKKSDTAATNLSKSTHQNTSRTSSSPSSSGSQEGASSTSETKSGALSNPPKATAGSNDSNMPILRSGTNTQPQRIVDRPKEQRQEKKVSQEKKVMQEKKVGQDSDENEQSSLIGDQISPATAAAATVLAAAAAKRKTPLVYQKKKTKWRLPDFVDKSGGKGTSWNAMIETWCYDLCADSRNARHASHVNATILLKALRNYFETFKEKLPMDQQIEGRNVITAAEKKGMLEAIAQKIQEEIKAGKKPTAPGTPNDQAATKQDVKEIKQEARTTDAPQQSAKQTTSSASTVVKDEPSASEWASLLDDPPARAQVKHEDDGPAPSQIAAMPAAATAAPNGDIIMDLRDEIGTVHYQLSRDDEVADLKRYFPGVPEKSVFCVFCHASGDHRANDCPHASPECVFCSSKSHTRFQCPERQRCEKCRQLGHAKATCKEKLKQPASEAECAYCASRTHGESACPLVWRTYFSAAACKKVQSIPAYCYCCGGEGHFGADCPDNRGRHPSGRTYLIADEDVWSAAARARYVDTASGDQPIAWQPPLPPGAPPVPQATDPIALPNIPGRSIVPRTHIHFTEDDDDDDDDVASFLNHGKRPARGGGGGAGRGGSAAGGSGNIRFSDFYQGGGGGRRGGGGGSGNSGSGSQGSGANSLPPRPPQGVRMGAYSFRPPPQNDYNSRGGGSSGRGRGGGGGGGGGGGSRGGVSKRGSRGRGRRGRA